MFFSSFQFTLYLLLSLLLGGKEFILKLCLTHLLYGLETLLYLDRFGVLQNMKNKRALYIQKQTITTNGSWMNKTGDTKRYSKKGGAEKRQEEQRQIRILAQQKIGRKWWKLDICSSFALAIIYSKLTLFKFVNKLID